MKNLVLFLSLFAFANIAHGKSSFDGVTKKLGKCYSRTYSAQHLKKYPQQTVTHMAAKFYYDTFYVEGETYHTPKLKIQAKAKGSNRIYGIELACSEITGRCAIDCDGPSVNSRFSTNNPGSMLIDNSENNLSLDPITCGDDVDEDSIEALSLWLNGTKGGDDIFLLHPVEDFKCL